MTIAVSHPEWSAVTFRSGDRQRVLEFLDRDHHLNIYLISRILESGLDYWGPTVGVFRNQSLLAVSSASPNLAVAVDPELDEVTLDEAMAVAARDMIARSTHLRAIISPARVVDSLWRHLSHHYQDPTVLRLSQPVYLLDDLEEPLDLNRVRRARSSDLDQLAPACAAMHREEIGIDPLARDAVGYRQRIRELIEQGRSFVWIHGERIAFKCEISAESDAAVQLMGVWTAPNLRGRGFARRGLAEVCGHVFRNGRDVTLFVNDFNLAARRLYERLGFRQIGENRALIW
jgi:uncharacterized protein